MENKLNKYGCRPSGDVCLEHDSPLITFGICADSPELKDFIQQTRTDTLRQIIPKCDEIHDIEPVAKEIWGIDLTND